MDKYRLITKEVFTAQNPAELERNIQHAVDQYVQHILKSGSLLTDSEPEDLAE